MKRINPSVPTIAFGDDRLPKRFWSKVSASADGCWNWTGSIRKDGYGRFTPMSYKTALAHRHAYSTLVSTPDRGMTCDHLCRNRRCVRPSHIEVVPFSVNVLRGVGAAAINSRKTHCSRGHAFDSVSSNGWRHCRACWSINSAKYRHRLRQRVGSGR